MLNKIPVLDKGYVAILGSSLNGKTLREIEKEHFQDKINRQLWNIATFTVQVRCPIFVQLYFQQAKLEVINTIEKTVECYTPDVSEINTGDVGVDKDIADHMKQTVEALLLTTEAFEKDGCDRFLSNSLIPVSVYNTVIVSGNLQSWINLIKRKGIPKPIEAYRSAIYDLMLAEWKELDIGR